MFGSGTRPPRKWPRNEKRRAQRFPAAPLFVADISRILFRRACSRRTGDGHSSPARNRFPARRRLATRVRPIPGTGRGLSSVTGQATRRPCLALHRMGFIVPRRSPLGRWALTPPFHPYRAAPTSAPRRFLLCDTFHRPRLAPRPSAYFPRHAAFWCSDFPLPPKRERPSVRGNRRRRWLRRQGERSYQSSCGPAGTGMAVRRVDCGSSVQASSSVKLCSGWRGANFGRSSPFASRNWLRHSR